MTAKQFYKAAETLRGRGKWDRFLVGAMGMCLIILAPLAMVNVRFLSVGWLWFSIFYILWECDRISYDPAYPVIRKNKENDLNIMENRRTVYASAVFPADRKTAVRASNNNRLIVSFIIVLGLIVQGLLLIKTDKLIYASPLIISPCLITLIYNISSVLMATRKGIRSYLTRQMCIVFILSFSGSGVTLSDHEQPDDLGSGVGTIMLLNALITLSVSLICYFKCLKDAENTARNGEKIGEIKK